MIVGEKLVTSVHSTGRAVAMSNGMHNGGGFDPGVRVFFLQFVVTVLLTVYFVVSCSWSLDGAAYGNNLFFESVESNLGMGGVIRFLMVKNLRVKINNI